jgi:hypothetical protein
MSFFAKIKQFFGGGTVKVELSVPPQVEKAGRVLKGKTTLNALSDQHVLELTVVLNEEWTTGRGEEKETKEFELGKITVQKAFDMKKGEVKDFEFELPFELLKSNADQLKEKGGALGVLGKAAAFANAEKSRYFVVAEADVKGAAFDPDAKKEIQLV